MSITAEAGAGQSDHGAGAASECGHPPGAGGLVSGLSPGSAREQEKHQIQEALSNPGQNLQKHGFVCVVHLVLRLCEAKFLERKLV